MGLNFFKDIFSIKSKFLKVKGHYIHQNRFAHVNIFATFIAFIAFFYKFSINSTDIFWQKIQRFKRKEMIEGRRNSPKLSYSGLFLWISGGKDDLNVNNTHIGDNISPATMPPTSRRELGTIKIYLEDDCYTSVWVQLCMASLRFSLLSQFFVIIKIVLPMILKRNFMLSQCWNFFVGGIYLYV